MKPPAKPFPGYRWRWATLTPTEGLNDPPVYFGVLRALAKLEDIKPSDERLMQTLKLIQKETKTSVTLARSTQRNIIRNSGQYWKALGLLKHTQPGIRLTSLGRELAEGNIAPTEFAITMVKTLELPNPRIERASEQRKWGELRIRPLLLVLDILAALDAAGGGAEAYLTPFELTRIVIPLAGEAAPVFRHVEAIELYRGEELDLSAWPDCAPGANDARMAREFLLFLEHYGLCTREQNGHAQHQKYFLSALEPSEVQELQQVDTSGLTTTEAVERVRQTLLPAAADRKRLSTTVLTRPLQARFRLAVLCAYSSTCLFTGASFPPVLEAVHIVPVAASGADALDNSLCLRVDVHRLFDAGHLRVEPSGRVHLSDGARGSGDYTSLPPQIPIPEFVSIDNIKWRWNYGSLGD